MHVAARRQEYVGRSTLGGWWRRLTVGLGSRFPGLLNRGGAHRVRDGLLPSRLRGLPSAWQPDARPCLF